MNSRYYAKKRTLTEREKDIIAVAATLLIIAAIFIFVPGLAKGEARKLYGTWVRTDGVYETYEFSSNGTLILSNENVSFSGKYTAKDNSLSVQLIDRHSDCTFYFEDDILVIVGADGTESRLKKADDIYITPQTTESTPEQ